MPCFKTPYHCCSTMLASFDHSPSYLFNVNHNREKTSLFSFSEAIDLLLDFPLLLVFVFPALVCPSTSSCTQTGEPIKLVSRQLAWSSGMIKVSPIPTKLGSKHCVKMLAVLHPLIPAIALPCSFPASCGREYVCV